MVSVLAKVPEMNTTGREWWGDREVHTFAPSKVNTEHKIIQMTHTYRSVCIWQNVPLSLCMHVYLSILFET